MKQLNAAASTDATYLQKAGGEEGQGGGRGGKEKIKMTMRMRAEDRNGEWGRERRFDYRVHLPW